MTRFSTGFLAGGLIGAAALTWALSDGKNRKRLARDGRKAVKKYNELMDGISDMF